MYSVYTNLHQVTKNYSPLVHNSHLLLKYEIVYHNDILSISAHPQMIVYILEKGVSTEYINIYRSRGSKELNVKHIGIKISLCALLTIEMSIHKETKRTCG